MINAGAARTWYRFQRNEAHDRDDYGLAATQSEDAGVLNSTP
jgi:hypothetical protein